MSELPAHIKAAIDRNVPPSMRGYFYRMVSKESSGDPNDVSSTGAKGLLQFTKGTGKAYGLLDSQGDRRGDMDANLQAGVRLTQDNANHLRGRLGREPTNSELALAHQQGAATAANMLTGKGNASPQALAVNGVDPAASPDAAARKIMNYYGFNRQQAPFPYPPGMTLTSNPMSGQPPNPEAMAPAAPVEADKPAASAEQPGFMDKLLGADGKGGAGTPFADAMAGLETMSKGLQPKVAPAAAAEAAKISPAMGGVDAGGGGGSPQNAAALMQALLMRNRRPPMGTTLTGMGGMGGYG